MDWTVLPTWPETTAVKGCNFKLTNLLPIENKHTEFEGLLRGDFYWATCFWSHFSGGSTVSASSQRNTRKGNKLTRKEQCNKMTPTQFFRTTLVLRASTFWSGPSMSLNSHWHFSQPVQQVVNIVCHWSAETGRGVDKHTLMFAHCETPHRQSSLSAVNCHSVQYRNIDLRQAETVT